MKKNHEFYMKKALIEAEKAFFMDEVPVGAVIVKDGKIIAKAHNLKDSKKSVTKHAELIAIEMASRKLNNWRMNECTIYITLAPCPMCASAIEQARFSKLIYGTDTNSYKNTEIMATIFEKSTISVENGILANECSIILKKFFINKR